MQIIKEKKYDWEKEKTKLVRVSYTSNNVLCLITQDGTHYNFNGEELDIIIKFIKKVFK